MDKEASNRRHVQEWACSPRALREHWPAVAVAVAPCLPSSTAAKGRRHRVSPELSTKGLCPEVESRPSVVRVQKTHARNQMQPSPVMRMPEPMPQPEMPWIGVKARTRHRKWLRRQADAKAHAHLWPADPWHREMARPVGGRLDVKWTNMTCTSATKAFAPATAAVGPWPQVNAPGWLPEERAGVASVPFSGGSIHCARARNLTCCEINRRASCKPGAPPVMLAGAALCFYIT
ncbi:hypothetical protein Purlil1_12132 [Purpureocillium lilacinum]|uniref:Uncharacterized protein n=1 Tax=Purpureocillium lilacinum TaxID=33203 RepID=A0ABR0BHR5_PURLI|nr:hypothetical protein Purlil1_12132 [Purpureocillium lilacinum]